MLKCRTEQIHIDLYLYSSLRRSIRESRLENFDRHREHQERTNLLYDTIEDLQEDIKEIGRKIDRQNPLD